MVGSLWCLMPLSTIVQLFCGGQFYWWRKPEKTTDLYFSTGSITKVLSHAQHSTITAIPSTTYIWLNMICLT
jgi:hypothetical protein